MTTWRPTLQAPRHGAARRLRDGEHTVVEPDRRPVQCLPDDCELVPQGVLGGDERRPSPSRQGEDHHPAEHRGVGQVEVDDVVLPLEQERAKPERPGQVPVAPGTERVHGEAGRLELRYQRVLGLEDVRHLVVEPLAVAVAHHVDQQLLGAAQPQGLDEHQDTPPRRPGTRRCRGGLRPALHGGRCRPRRQCRVCPTPLSDECSSFPSRGAGHGLSIIVSPASGRDGEARGRSRATPGRGRSPRRRSPRLPRPEPCIAGEHLSTWTRTRNVTAPVVRARRARCSSEAR